MIPKKRFDEVNNELKALRAKVGEFERAQLSATERLQAEAKAAQEAAAAAQSQLRQARATAAVATAAGKHGVDPSLVQRLVDVEWDDDGEPVNVDAAVLKVLQAYPQLKPSPVSVAATNPARQSKLTKDDIKRMSSDEINRRWDEVQLVLSGQ